MYRETATATPQKKCECFLKIYQKISTNTSWCMKTSPDCISSRVKGFYRASVHCCLKVNPLHLFRLLFRLCLISIIAPERIFKRHNKAVPLFSKHRTFFSHHSGARWLCSLITQHACPNIHPGFRCHRQSLYQQLADGRAGSLHYCLVIGSFPGIRYYPW